MFKPDLSNTRTRRRCQTALAFVESRFSATRPRAWSTRDIDRHFTQQQNPISQWLRSQLLVEHNGYYNSLQGKCKEYLLNTQGVNELKYALGLDADTAYILPELTQEFHKELATLDFQYTDKSHRLWNPIQNIRTEYRDQLLANHGLKYNYDIEAAAPCLLIQQARQLGFSEETPRIDEYIQDREQVRLRISQETGLDVVQVKRVINAVFCGAIISHWPDSSILAMCNNSHHYVDELQGNVWVNELKEEIKLMWQEIFKNQRQRDPLTGKLKRITSKQRWQVYFELERSVLDVIRSYLKKQQINCFLIHDGFTTDRAVNTMELEDRIRQTTGFLVRLSVEITHE